MDAYGTREREVEVLRQRACDHMDVVNEQMVSLHVHKAAGGIVAGSVIVGVILAGGHQALSGTLDAADLIAFVYYAVEIRNHTVKFFDAATEALVAISTCTEVLELAHEGMKLPKELPHDDIPVKRCDDDIISSKANGHKLTPIPDAPNLLIESLSVIHVKYPNHLPLPVESHSNIIPALNALELTVRSGEIVAVVGISGAGKTTLVDAIMGFNEPFSGKVLYYGFQYISVNRVCDEVQDNLNPHFVSYFMIIM